MNPEENDGKPSLNRSADVIPALPAPVASGAVSKDSEYTVEDYRTALRLLVGAILEGNDEIRIRTSNRRESLRQRELEAEAPLEQEGGSPLLYTLLGLMFKAPDYLYWAVSTADNISTRAANFTSKLFRPFTNSRFMRPVRRGLDDLVERGESVVHPLEARGRYETRFSRALVRQEVNDEMVEESLVYLVERSKMRELIAETSAEVGSDALDEVRGRSASVDSLLDDIIDNILRRKKHETPPPSSLP